MKEVHPLADLMPTMSDAEFGELVKDIAANGLMAPVTLWEGKVLDGRHRDRACEEAGVEARYESYRGDAPAMFVVSANLHRRHLTASQRAAIAVDLLPYFEKEARKRRSEGQERGRASRWGDVVPRKPALDGSRDGRAATHAAKVVGVGSRTVQEAKRVKQDAPDLYEKVKNGKMSTSAASDEARRRAEASGGPRKPAAVPAADTKRGQQIRAAHRKRFHVLMGTLDGLSAAAEMPLEAVLEDTEHLKGWIATINEAKASLNRLRERLKEGVT